VQLGSADVSFAWRKKYNDCEQASNPHDDFKKTKKESFFVISAKNICGVIIRHK
jgi:hypothetical protein